MTKFLDDESLEPYGSRVVFTTVQKFDYFMLDTKCHFVVDHVLI